MRASLHPSRKSVFSLATILYLGVGIKQGGFCKGAALGQKSLERLQDLLANCYAPTQKLSVLFNP